MSIYSNPTCLPKWLTRLQIAAKQRRYLHSCRNYIKYNCQETISANNVNKIKSYREQLIVQKITSTTNNLNKFWPHFNDFPIHLMDALQKLDQLNTIL
jgi:hypothetical protein